MNALNNNILPIQVNDELLKYLFDEVFKNPKIKIKIDLPEQILIINDKSIKFDVDNYKKMCLINGWRLCSTLFNSGFEIKCCSDCWLINTGRW